MGFSYASKADSVVNTEEEVGEDLYQFLQVRQQQQQHEWTFCLYLSRT